MSPSPSAAHLDLGQPGEALADLTRALDLLDRQAPHRVRDRAHYLIRTARTHLARGDVHQACTVADRVLELTGRVHSPRVIDRLVEFLDELLRWIRDEKVQEFLYRSRRLMPSPPPRQW